MTFIPENYPAHWKQFSEYVRFERAQNKCEQCNAPNNTVIERGYLGELPIWFDGNGGTFCAKSGEYLGTFHSYDLDKLRVSRIVLTVAHLDHEGGICDCKQIYGFKCAKPSHCLALCQSCHLSLDRPHHLKVQAENRAIKKDAQRGLLEFV